MVLLPPHSKSLRLLELRLWPLRDRRKRGREQVVARGLEGGGAEGEEGLGEEEEARLSLLSQLLLLLMVELLLQLLPVVVVAPVMLPVRLCV